MSCLLKLQQKRSNLCVNLLMKNSLRVKQAKTFKSLKNSQPQMEIYWFLQKTSACVFRYLKYSSKRSPTLYNPQYSKLRGYKFCSFEWVHSVARFTLKIEGGGMVLGVPLKPSKNEQERVGVDRWEHSTFYKVYHRLMLRNIWCCCCNEKCY